MVVRRGGDWSSSLGYLEISPISLTLTGKKVQRSVQVSAPVSSSTEWSWLEPTNGGKYGGGYYERERGESIRGREGGRGREGAK